MKKLHTVMILLLLGFFRLSPSLQAADTSNQPVKFATIDVPGALFTAANGINAQATSWVFI